MLYSCFIRKQRRSNVFCILLFYLLFVYYVVVVCWLYVLQIFVKLLYYCDSHHCTVLLRVFTERHRWQMRRKKFKNKTCVGIGSHAFIIAINTYTFLYFQVGGDGLVYEGRGWGKHGAHLPKLNSRSLGICLLGNFQSNFY